MSFRPIAIDISPNSSWQDCWRAVWLILTPWRWQRAAPLYELEEGFKERFGFQEALAVDSGRSALYLALKAAGIGQGDEVILQAFTCFVVPMAILWTGAKPVYVDIDRSFNIDPKDLAKKLSPKTKAVIVQHTFGYPADMKRILSSVSTHQSSVRVIEDCAHSLGAAYQGRPVGTWGDIAIFSFGRDKVISSVYGGLLGINNRRLAQKIKQAKAELAQMSNRKTFQGLFHPIAFGFILPVYNSGVGRFLAWLFQKIGLISRVITKTEKQLGRPANMPARLAPAIAVMALGQLERLDEFNRRRQNIAKFYFKALKDKKDLKLTPKPRPEDTVIFLRFPVLIKNPDKLIRFAAKKGIYLGNWYRPVIAPGYLDLKKLGYQQGMALKAEAFSNQVVNLPTYPALKTEQAKQVAELFQQKAYL